MKYLVWLTYPESLPDDFHNQRTRKTCTNGREQRYCEFRDAIGAANSVKGVRGSQGTEIGRKSGGRTNSESRQRIHKETKGG